jgi:hypothetical protein
MVCKHCGLKGVGWQSKSGLITTGPLYNWQMKMTEIGMVAIKHLAIEISISNGTIN